ncbi:DUF3429 domain-containing protein [Marinomonas profundi]|uniref:DUF3429 domain-containing protein n=1 Tax=Marinomonas profundi TaxID=2726122 RepID=UPI002E27C432|nr:DUF3429 domain-containing protein [Marinomonas profundi]
MSQSTLYGTAGITLFATYAAITLSFISGIIWGKVLEQEQCNNGKKLLLACNMVLLVAWITLLINAPELSIALLLLGFISIFWVEARWLKPSNNNKPSNDNKSYYLSMHFGLTSLVCSMHLLVLYPHY